jgi:hypothetical protein
MEKPLAARKEYGRTGENASSARVADRATLG